MTTRNASPGPAMPPPTATARSPCSSCIPVASFLCGVRASPAAPGGHGLSGRPSLSAFPTVTPGLRRRISPIALRIPAPRSPARRTRTGPLIWNEATQSWDEPAEDDDWGDLHFRGAAPDAGGEWTDDGSHRELRQLKQRAVGDSRIVPTPPPLTRILRAHIRDFGTAPDGRLFTGVRGGELPTITDQSPPGRTHPRRASLTAGPPPVRPASRLPVYLAQRRRGPHPGRRMGRPQR
jgi:hypothetical protein